MDQAAIARDLELGAAARWGVMDLSLVDLTTDELFARLKRLEASARYDRARDSAERVQTAWLSVTAEINRRQAQAK